jgi:glycosyltransferase involved in cell wall biosynthesis
MKIGVDIRLIGKKQTGSEAVFFNLVKNLSEIDSTNSYKLFTDTADGTILDKIKDDLVISDRNNFEIISLKTANKFTWNFIALPKYLRKNPVDIYLTQYITPFFVPKKIKIITIIHDISFNFYPQFIKWSDLFFLKFLIPISLRRADKIIGVSKFTHDEIIKYYKIDPKKVVWIHNAVSDNFMAKNITDERIKAVRGKYNLPETHILYLGTLQPRKNIPALIEAYALAKDKLGDVKLVIAGGKGHNFDKSIESSIKKYRLSEKVIMPGFIDEEDKAALMKSAKIFVFPSLYEGFGIPILEAMAVGVPAIVSDIAPHREIAENAVLYFNPAIPRELASKMAWLLNNPVAKENLVDEGLRQAGKFSWKKTAEKMAGVFGNM